MGDPSIPRILIILREKSSRFWEVVEGVEAFEGFARCCGGLQCKSLSACRSRQLPQTLNIQTLSALTTMPAVQNNLSSRIKTAARETTFVLFFLFGFNVKRLNSLNLL